MKLKQSHNDFRVEERTDVVPGDDGPFTLYELEKRGWTTPDALQAIRRRWKIDFNRLSYGGLKDRHAHTKQLLTIYRGPQRNFQQQGIELRCLGRLTQPYTSSDIRANAFTLTLRDLHDDEVTLAIEALRAIRDVGVPNYFDDQRFGSVSDGKSFVAREMVLGRFEEALKLALAAPYAFDRADAKKEKAILRQCWGDWKVCKERLSRGHARSLVDYLVSHPTDFRGALARLRPELQGLYLSAYQSHLWNRMLARWLEQHVPAEQLESLELRLGPVPVPRAIPAAKLEEWNTLMLPLPSARLKLAPSDPALTLVESIMAEEGYALSEMKIRGMHKPFFSKGDRIAALRPDRLEYHDEYDDRQKGKRKLILSFELPRGAYATMVVKRITEAGEPGA